RHGRSSSLESSFVAALRLVSNIVGCLACRSPRFCVTTHRPIEIARRVAVPQPAASIWRRLACRQTGIHVARSFTVATCAKRLLVLPWLIRRHDGVHVPRQTSECAKADCAGK